jgi:membrane fusion protein, macrolide-specific efflux system
MKKLKWFSWVCILAVIAGASVWGFRRKERGRSEEKYETTPVTRGDIAVTIQATGVVRPQNRLEIKPAVAGRLEKVLVNEGDEVKAGQIVVWMSSTDRAALLDAARASGPDEVARWEEIYKATPLVAPLEGEIIDRVMEPGQTVTPSDPVLVMSDKLIIEAQVDETDLAQIRLRQEASVALDAYPDQSFTAFVSHIAYEAETVDNVTIYKVQVLPEKMPEFVRSGMTANLTFTTQTAQRTLLVPAEAVHDRGGKQVVLVPSGNAEKPGNREVQTGLTDGKNIQIASGLEEGDLVLVPKVQTPLSSGPAKSNPFMPFGARGVPRRGGSGH